MAEMLPPPFLLCCWWTLDSLAALRCDRRRSSCTFWRVASKLAMLRRVRATRSSSASSSSGIAALPSMVPSATGLLFLPLVEPRRFRERRSSSSSSPSLTSRTMDRRVRSASERVWRGFFSGEGDAADIDASMASASRCVWDTTGCGGSIGRSSGVCLGAGGGEGVRGRAAGRFEGAFAAGASAGPEE
ncbi:hypothetical protein ACKVWC_011601 [Pyricularia oryzae]